MMIRDFQQLRELRLEVKSPEYSHKVLLSSISSTELRKITFLGVYLMYDRMDEWDLIDKQLCKLADLLRARGYQHTLEAEAQVSEAGADPGYYNPSCFLPKFRDKGVVTIVHGDWLHSSTHVR